MNSSRLIRLRCQARTARNPCLNAYHARTGDGVSDRHSCVTILLYLLALLVQPAHQIGHVKRNPRVHLDGLEARSKIGSGTFRAIDTELDRPFCISSHGAQEGDRAEVTHCRSYALLYNACTAST